MLCYVRRKWDCCTLSDVSGNLLGCIDTDFEFGNSKPHDNRLWQSMPGWRASQVYELFVLDEEG